MPNKRSGTWSNQNLDFRKKLPTSNSSASSILIGWVDTWMHIAFSLSLIWFLHWFIYISIWVGTFEYDSRRGGMCNLLCFWSRCRLAWYTLVPLWVVGGKEITKASSSHPHTPNNHPVLQAPLSSLLLIVETLYASHENRSQSFILGDILVSQRTLISN